MYRNFFHYVLRVTPKIADTAEIYYPVNFMNSFLIHKTVYFTFQCDYITYVGEFIITVHIAQTYEIRYLYICFFNILFNLLFTHINFKVLFLAEQSEELAK